MGALSMLVHGDAGVGKSWLADTAPAPRLILDAEGRARYLPSEPKVFWDPAREAPPVAGDWQTCVATVTSFETMSQAHQWLRSGQHCFRSVSVDSLMEIQMRLIDVVAGVGQLQTQDWGEVLRRLESLVRSYRDLVLLPGTVECVVFTCGTKEVEGKKGPLLQGQLRDKLPYFMDAVGYLHVVYTAENTMQRQLLVHPMPNIVAKDGTGRLPGPLIASPNLTQLFDLLNGGTHQP